MKSKITIIGFVFVVFTALCFLFGSSVAYSQEDTVEQIVKVVKKAPYTHAITADAFDFLLSKAFHITYEQQLNKINSFTVFASFYNYSFNAYALGGSYMWYPYRIIPDNRKALEGFRLGPYINFIIANDKTTYFHFAFGPEFAYKMVFDDFAVEPILRFNITMGLDYTSFKSVGLGCNLGYAWK